VSDTAQRPREMIDVRGRSVHIVRRAPRSQSICPTFVIEAACGWHAAMYQWIITELAEQAGVLAYDRLGLGWSESSRGPPDAEARAAELKALITATGLKGPYIFVGHSIAGLFLRVYSHRWPADVAALVFLDATHPLVCRILRGRTPIGSRSQYSIAMAAHRLHVKRLPFSLRPVGKPPWNKLPRDAGRDVDRLGRSPMQAATECAELQMLSQSAHQAVACGSLGDVPLLVITGGERTKEELRYADNPGTFMDTWMMLQRDLVTLSTRGTHCVIAGAGHQNLVTDKKFANLACAEIVRFVHDIVSKDTRN
jgi:pimeloyl-ACP methyl ester carboxylesterase